MILEGEDEGRASTEGMEAAGVADGEEDLFERLNMLKKDEELMSLAQDFVQQLLLKAQEEARRRGTAAQHRNKVIFSFLSFFSKSLLYSLFLSCNDLIFLF